MKPGVDVLNACFDKMRSHDRDSSLRKLACEAAGLDLSQCFDGRLADTCPATV